MSFVEFIDSIFRNSLDYCGERVCNIRWELTEKSSYNTILGEGGYYIYVDLDQSPQYEHLGSGMVPLLIKEGKLYTGWETQYPRYEVPSDIAIEVLGHLLETFARKSSF